MALLTFTMLTRRWRGTRITSCILAPSACCFKVKNGLPGSAVYVWPVECSFAAFGGSCAPVAIYDLTVPNPEHFLHGLLEWPPLNTANTPSTLPNTTSFS